MWVPGLDVSARVGPPLLATQPGQKINYNSFKVEWGWQKKREWPERWGVARGIPGGQNGK